MPVSRLVAARPFSLRLWEGRDTLEELEPEPEVPDEVHDSLVPSQGDLTPNSAKGESSQAPSAAPLVAAPPDANVLLFGLLKHMTDLVGILTTPLKPNGAAASGSTRVKVVKMLSIKIPPPKAFEGDRDNERVATWLGNVPIECGMWKGKKVLSSTRWTTSISSWA